MPARNVAAVVRLPEAENGRDVRLNVLLDALAHIFPEDVGVRYPYMSCGPARSAEAGPVSARQDRAGAPTPAPEGQLMDPVSELTRDQLEEIVRRVREALWLTRDGWAPHKEWDEDTCSAVADALTGHGLSPAGAETRECDNCGQDFVRREGDEAHDEGFCCRHCLNQHRGDGCPPGCPYCLDAEDGDDTPAVEASVCAEPDPPDAAEGERLYEATAYVVVSRDRADGGTFPDEESLRRALDEDYRLHLDPEEESNPCGIASIRLEWDTLRRAGEADGAVPAPVREALRNVLHDCWADEKDDAEDHLRENGTLAGHVFADLVALDNWLHGTGHTPESYLTDEDDPVAEARRLLDDAGDAPDAATLDRLQELYATLGHQAGCARRAGNGMGPCDCLRGELAAFLQEHGRGD